MGFILLCIGHIIIMQLVHTDGNYVSNMKAFGLYLIGTLLIGLGARLL